MVLDGMHMQCKEKKQPLGITVSQHATPIGERQGILPVHAAAAVHSYKTDVEGRKFCTTY